MCRRIKACGLLSRMEEILIQKEMTATPSDESVLAAIVSKTNRLISNSAASPPVIGILTKSVREEERPIKDYSEIVEPKYLLLLQDAVVVPISLYSTREELRDILSRVNGVCLPGGHTNVWKSEHGNLVETDYTKAGRQIIDLVLEQNSANRYLPLLGICLGFELLAACIGRDLSLVQPCADCCDYSAALAFTPSAARSRLFGSLAPEQRVRLASAELSFNFHSYSVLADRFRANRRLHDMFAITATSRSRTGLREFVSSFEGRGIPIYATQHHPEWCLHDFYTPRVNVVRTPETVRIGREIGKFFVSEAMKGSRGGWSREELRRRALVNCGVSFRDQVKGYVYLANRAVRAFSRCAIA